MAKPKRKRSQVRVRTSGEPTSRSPQRPPKERSQPANPITRGQRLVAFALVLATGVVAYWPNFVRFVSRWWEEPDYSHGFLVIPFIAYCLFERRRDFPQPAPRFAWGGLLLLAIAVGCRVFGGAFFIEAIEDWSILFWAAGSVWLLFGFSAFLWSAPFVGFLFFMIPLPFRIEEGLALPLQRIATKLSTWTLQAMGQPALDQGNTITIGTEVMEVRRACSGLRIFMSMIAVGVAMVLLSPSRPRWQKGLLLLATIPIAVIANATRIIVTGLLHQYASGDYAKAFSHDFAGFAMIVYAIVLFCLLIWYVDRLFPLYSTINPRLESSADAGS